MFDLSSIVYGKSGVRLVCFFGYAILLAGFLFEILCEAPLISHPFSRSGSLALAVTFFWFSQRITTLNALQSENLMNRARLEAREHLIEVNLGRAMARNPHSVGELETRANKAFMIDDLKDHVSERDKVLKEMSRSNANAVGLLTAGSTLVWGFGDQVGRLINVW